MLNAKQLVHLPSKKTWAGFAMGAALGCLFFLLVYGPSTLNVRYDSWIYAGYAEWDIVQHYAGWMFFRQADWSWPLTVADNLAQPLGVSISFTDSEPWVALLLKPFSALLPATFQYFGWYNLLNCMLQGGFAFVLLQYFCKNPLFCAVGSILFISYPIQVERLFRHSSLGAQWMLLAALVCYVAARRGRLPYVGFFLLCVLSPGITTYFTPMVFAILLAALLQNALADKNWLRPALYLGVCALGTLAAMYLLGILTRGGGGEAAGFGEFSMNLNALANPSSLDDYAADKTLAWSRVLPVLPQRHRQYDGFNYLGLGVLAGLALMLVYYAATLLRPGRGQRLRQWRGFLARHAVLLLVVALMALFALSNVVTLNETVLFTLPLPQSMLRLCAIFRASGRFFWPASYLLLLWLLLFIYRRLAGRWATLALLSLTALQLFDLSGVLYAKHQYFAQPVYANNEFETDDWIWFASNYDNVVCLGPIFDYDMAAGIIRYNPEAQTNILLANRGNFAAVEQAYDGILDTLRGGAPLDDNTIWLCTDDETLAYAMEGIHPDARAYRTGRYRIIAVPTADCPVAEYTIGTAEESEA